MIAPLRPRTAVDVGCGAGIHALLAARHAQCVVAIDSSARAAAFARFNAWLNGLSGVEVRTGNLFGPVAGQRFSLIVSNPPFGFSNDSEVGATPSSGGATGDRLALRVLAAVPAHLESGGLAIIKCPMIDWRDRTFEDSVRGCMPEDSTRELGVLLLGDDVPTSAVAEHYRASAPASSIRQIMRYRWGTIVIARRSPGRGFLAHGPLEIADRVPISTIMDELGDASSDAVRTAILARCAAAPRV
jgi:methylase of polypeptide subunit release factors